MINGTGQGLNRAKKLLLASAGVAALVGLLVIGAGHTLVAEASAAPLTPAPQEPKSAASAPSPAFEVASVKAAVEPVREPMFCIGPCAFGERFSVVGSRVDIRYMSLYNLIVTAYRIKPY